MHPRIFLPHTRALTATHRAHIAHHALSFFRFLLSRSHTARYTHTRSFYAHARAYTLHTRTSLSLFTSSLSCTQPHPHVANLNNRITLSFVAFLLFTFHSSACPRTLNSFCTGICFLVFHYSLVYHYTPILFSHVFHLLSTRTALSMSIFYPHAHGYRHTYHLIPHYAAPVGLYFPAFTFICRALP